MENITFNDTYFIYCNERCVIEGLITELEKFGYFDIEIEDINNFKFYPVDRAAFSIIALTESANDDIIKSAIRLTFEDGKVKSPYIIIADPSIKSKLKIHFNEIDSNLIFFPFTLDEIREVIVKRKMELHPFQCNLSIPEFHLNTYQVRIGKYTSEGISIYEDEIISKIFNAYIIEKSINQHSFSEMVKSLFHRKQQLTNKIRINSKSYLLYILPIPSNSSINFTLMNY
jgi:hypothetical protein